MAAVAVLYGFGGAPGELAAFGGYIGIGVLLPGTLLWRALSRGGGSLPADLAAGLALGYAVEVLVYIPARAAGMPLLVLAWPAATITAFLAVPRLRAHWRGRGGRVPGWWAWGMSAVVGYLVAWSALVFYRVHGLTWPGNAAPYVDMPYHLALLGEVKHHVPPTLPVVLGERLAYHWFVYAEMSATSWVTGIEPQTLLYRLSALPMLAATAVLVSVIAVRLTGRWWTGPAAIGFTCFVSSPELHQGGVELFTARSLFTAWLSPTQNFGTLLFALVVLLLVDSLRQDGKRQWAAVSILLLALTGAKATFLPLLLGGLVLVLAVRWLVDRRLHRPAVTAAEITVACLLIAQFVVFGRDAQGMTIAPLDTMRRMWRVAADLSEPEMAAAPLRTVLGMAAIYLFCLACVWAGLSGLIIRRARTVGPATEPPESLGAKATSPKEPQPEWDRLVGPGAPQAGSRWAVVADPAVLLLVGIGAAGIGALLLLAHPAIGQLYFLEGARPYLSIAAVVGASAMVAARRDSWPLAVCALVAGAGLAYAAKAFGPDIPVRHHRFPDVAEPYLALALVAAVVWLLLVLCRRPVGLVLLALVTGYLVPSTVAKVASPFGPPGVFDVTVPAGAVEAGRWLRDHSAPDDVVATNAHCRPLLKKHCDSRHFWVSGYSERRVLVEGWAYAASTLSRAHLATMTYVAIPFADPARLAANDAVFREPSAKNVEELVRKYRVKWLLVDNSVNPPAPTLGKFAELRFHSGACSVYELTGR
ncbi:hypothetical protein ABT294_05820 [Nonomuraea sp. NPDC000554]|uniref:hypothetical protein n=1 Tax=Nonomuraea sp. NPDC000554 TaxID=3154259 RepID=UPI00332A2B78